MARGGGSLEDLWGFNDEAVVRAAAESGIPLVSAVGHETDTTLIDHAADVRAPTPTGAAEIIVPVRSELLAAVDGFGGRLGGGLRRLVERRKTELRSAARALPTPEALLAQHGSGSTWRANGCPRALPAASTGGAWRSPGSASGWRRARRAPCWRSSEAASNSWRAARGAVRRAAAEGPQRPAARSRQARLGLDAARQCLRRPPDACPAGVRA